MGEHKAKRLREGAVRAAAKINTFLEIIGKREDGYHDLETVFQSIDVCDEINITETDAHQQTLVSYVNVELQLAQSDICWQAVQLLRQECDDIPGIDIEIKKEIPIGGGLGGASSNAAAILKALANWYHIESPRLAEIALMLGSDVPFFLTGGRAYATGRGDSM